MKSLGCALALTIGLMTVFEAAAGVKTVVKVETYRITGDSGEALVQAMNRKGPRGGLLTRDIAQTRYLFDWKLDWSVVGGRCRLKTIDVVVSVNRRIPELSGPVPASLKKRWTKFMIGLRKEEESAGRLVQQTLARTQKAALKVAVDNDPSCRKASRRVSQIARSIYADYKARLQRFYKSDQQSTDRLIGDLTKPY